MGIFKISLLTLNYLGIGLQQITVNTPIHFKGLHYNQSRCGRINWLEKDNKKRQTILKCFCFEIT